MSRHQQTSGLSGGPACAILNVVGLGARRPAAHAEALSAVRPSVRCARGLRGRAAGVNWLSGPREPNGVEKRFPLMNEEREQRSGITHSQRNSQTCAGRDLCT
ncbi:hypothetical protein AAFF_G00217280 [Aldrovandia affinis]|uniref:Uncharacterized protein n=1 Tax=Aldrovandia affinis TaxID=143900 RepID=A0AAD7SVP2_9TELE|nr:hypothetical protein AAFF_G00217280 [Aldrovandia affinis]